MLAAADAPFRHASLPELLTKPFWPESALADARAPYYRPLVLLSLKLDLARGGTGLDFHATNCALHLVCAALLAVVAMRLRASPVAAISAAGLWALAPRLTESVVWISGRTDVLATAFGLGALAVWPLGGHGTRGTWWRALAGAALLFGALASKEVGLAFAVAIIAAGGRGAWLVGPPIAAWLGLRSLALAGHSAPLRDLGALRRGATVLETVERYAEMTVDALRPRTSIGMLGEVDTARAAIGAALLVALVAGALALRRRRSVIEPGIRAALALAAVSLGLVLHVVPFTLAGSVAADRLLYVPLAGLAVGLAVGANRLAPRRRRVVAALAGALALVFAASTRARIEDYREETRFWVVAAENAHPHNTLALAALGALVRDAGEIEPACRLFDRASAILASSERRGLAAHRRARENLVGCWARAGQYDAASALAEALSGDYPDSGRIAMALGYVRLDLRDFTGAKAAFGRAVTLEPNLEPIVAPAAGAIPIAESEWQRFEDPSARAAAPTAWARHLARIGRAPDAETAYLAVATSDAASAADRTEADRYLVLDGSVPHADEAARAWPLPLDLRRELEARRARREPVIALGSRIAALGRSPM